MAIATQDNRGAEATQEFSFQAWVPSEDTSDEEDSASSSSTSGCRSRQQDDGFLGQDLFLLCDEDINLDCPPSPGSKRRRHSLNDQEGSLAKARAQDFSHVVMLSGKARRVEAADWLNLSYPRKLPSRSTCFPELQMCSKA